MNVILSTNKQIKKNAHKMVNIYQIAYVTVQTLF